MDDENSDRYELKPGFCLSCHQTFVHEEKQKRFFYSDSPIYVKKIVTEESFNDKDPDDNNNVCILYQFIIN